MSDFTVDVEIASPITIDVEVQVGGPGPTGPAGDGGVADVDVIDGGP